MPKARSRRRVKTPPLLIARTQALLKKIQSKVDALMQRVGFPQGLLPLNVPPAQAAQSAVAASVQRVNAARIQGLRRDALRTLELLAGLLRA